MTRVRALPKIEKQTFRAAEIVNNLFNFSRMNGTRFEPLDLNTLIRDVLSLLEHQLRSANRGAARASRGGPGARQQQRLQQVFVNLILNARDAMPRRPDENSDPASDGNILTDIRDTGQGIDRRHHAHLRSVLHHQGWAGAPGSAWP